MTLAYSDALAPTRTPTRVPTRRVQLGRVLIDAVTFNGALDAVTELVERGEGGAVFTPNVDHIVQVEKHQEFHAAYRRASLTLADGAFVVWATRVLGRPVPAKVSGSDLVWPLVERAAQHGWRVYLVGGRPGAAAEVARRAQREHGLNVVGVDDGTVDLSDAESCAASFARARAARPDLVLVAFGSPKQEVWIDRARAAIGPAVAIGVGATFDFLAGHVRRAPAWMSRAGLEWLFRLCQEPRRMWRRYLLRDPVFVLVVLRTALQAWRTKEAGA
ncbi:glycosyl transferase, WecB/TagA/CpsF family [Gemmatirosa kalamazoonensis]|uniref:Glycosyl transferase, WecB/TagA/CpsF family n=1 Tax=Gemmatirosa kalamazoonensis TaxID=861299 RepID=W0RB50_9BACT|nr:WecB/TagA/CpsF family glycosyltransferase [Gemmatirosa kalamazoonensis]AHG87677.1 glycosyl transferase, WecB/TagA/CpsF family [Gemmatirosa kalamazoonensis]